MLKKLFEVASAPLRDGEVKQVEDGVAFLAFQKALDLETRMRHCLKDAEIVFGGGAQKQVSIIRFQKRLALQIRDYSILMGHWIQGFRELQLYSNFVVDDHID